MAHEDEADSAAFLWRRIALERQLPRTRVLAGVGVPSWVTLCCLVLLAGVCLVYLGTPRPAAVEEAIVESQRQIVADLARGLDVQARSIASTIAAHATEWGTASPADPSAVLDIVESITQFTGAAVLNAQRAVIAARGDAVPVDAIPPAIADQHVFPYVGATDVPRLVIAQRLADGKVLVALFTVVIRPLFLDTAAEHSIYLYATPTVGVHSQGATLTGEAMRAVERALDRSAGRRVATATRIGAAGAAGSTGDVSAMIAAAAPVGATGFSVVSALRAPVVPPDGARVGAIATAALLVVAAAVFALLQLCVVQPAHRLLAHAKAVASGGRGRRIRRTRMAEIATMTAALDGVSARLRGHVHLPVRRRYAMSAGRLVAIATVLVLGWAGSVAYVYTFGRTRPEVPGQVMTARQNLVDGVAAALRESLREGQRRVAQAAIVNVGAQPNDLRPVIADLATERRFRSVYVADAGGRVLAHAGSDPLRALASVPMVNGVRIDDEPRRVPAIYGYAWVSHRHVIIAEFDVRYLNRFLDRIGGRVHVVDARMRTILNTEGYVAFEELRDRGLRDLLDRGAADSPRGRVITISGVRTLVNSSEADISSASTDLRLHVVAQQAVNELALFTNRNLHRAWLVALLAASIALLLIVWHYYRLIRPLRALARAAGRLADGDTRTVIAPPRLDEIGSIAICLDICRQALVHGRKRLGGAIRMRGDDGDHTAVLARIVAPREPSDDERASTADTVTLPRVRDEAAVGKP